MNAFLVSLVLLFHPYGSDDPGDTDLNTLADILEGYHLSIETLRIRATTVWLDNVAKAADPNLFGAGDTAYDTLLRDHDRIFLENRLQRADGARYQSTHYVTADGTYQLSRAKEGITHVTISKRDLFEYPAVIRGFYTRDGRPLFVLLRDQTASILGRESVDNASCYKVQLMDGPVRVVCFFDESHDYLCRKRVFTGPNGTEVASWEVAEFIQVSNRWFPNQESNREAAREGRNKGCTPDL